MEKIIKKDGYVYLVQDFEKKGFEIFHNLGKDPDLYEEEIKEADKPKKTKKQKKSED